MFIKKIILLMSTVWFCCAVSLLFAGVLPVRHAAQQALAEHPEGFSSDGAWFFSGRVHDEQNLHYDYFFKAQRQEAAITLQAVLMQVERQEVLLSEQVTQPVVDNASTKWQAGSLFLAYQPINHRWVVGAKNRQGVAFNFKIDMLPSSHSLVSKRITLPSAVQLDMSKTGRLNGHIITGSEKEEVFVSETNTWFSRIDGLQWSQKKTKMSVLLCDFDDQEGFFFIASETNKIPHTYAFWHKADGQSLPVSQFLTLTQSDNRLQVHSAAPKFNIEVHNALAASDPLLIMGKVQGYRSTGFCLKNQFG